MLKFPRWFPIKSIRFGLAALALPLLLSCEAPAPRDWLGPSTSESDFQRLSVAPRTGRLLIGDSMAVVAWGHRRNGDSVVVNATWTARGGAIYGGRWFHAEAAGYGAIRAISATTPMLVDSAIVQVGTVMVTPPDTSVNAGSSIQARALARFPDNTVLTPEVAWSTTGGSISAAGLYTAPDYPGIYYLIAQFLGHRISASTRFQVTLAELRLLVLNPSVASVVAGATLQFTLAAAWSDGSSALPAVIWTATGGTISASGLYSAGPTAGTFRVTATASAGGLADTSEVVITVPAPVLTQLALTPSTVTLPPGGTTQYAVSAAWSDGSSTVPAVSYAATGGGITPTGLYTAGPTPGSFRVIVTHAGGLKADTSAVTISAPVVTLLTLALNPPSVTLLPGGTQPFSVAGAWSDGSAAAPPVSYAATGGVITPAGLYTAGSTPGAFRVIATHLGGTRADTSTVTISLPPATLTALVLSPSSATLVVGATRQFAVSGTWSDGSATTPAVNYSSTGGTITGGGLYTAGATPGTFRVIATHAASTRADTSAVTIAVPPAALTALVLTPATLTVAPGGTGQFTAAGTWSDGSTLAPPVTWSATGGTIAAGGLYTAWATPGTFRVIATHQGGTRADTSTVTISVPPATLTALVLNPSTVTLVAGGTSQFAVRGTWSDGSSATPAVVYSPTGGTITADGLYTAGATPGTFRVIATHQGGTRADTSAVTIAVPPPTLTTLVLNPSAVTLETGGTRQFAVTGTWSDGSSAIPAVTYSPTGGTITAGGLYTAGATSGTFRVIATHQGGTRADTSAVTISVPPPTLTDLSIVPSSVTLLTGGSQQFAVSGTWSNGATTAPVVTYAATGGTIAAGGLYTAGATAGTFRVIAAHQGGTRADTASVTLTVPPPTLTSLVLNPSAVTLVTGGTRQFVVSGTWSDGSSATPAVVYSATGGTITVGGLYTAGAAPGTFRVIAVHQSGTRADTSAVTISVPPPTLTALVLTPSSATLVAGATRQFEVSGTWSDGSTLAPPVTWSASGGTIAAGGLYTAGATPGTFRVIATHQGGTRADTASVTITVPPPTLANLVLTPASVTLATGGSQQFAVSGTWSDGSSATPAVNYSSTGGTITVGGLYTAGVTPGTFRVIATHQGGTRADTAVMTVAAQTLRQLASARGFQIGVAVRDSAFSQDPAYQPLLRTQYNSIGTEDATDFGPIHPGANTYRFGPADALVDFAAANGMAFHGHTLIWGSWIPPWVTNGGFSRDSLFGVMRSHIMTVVGRYRNRAESWDVLNEMLDYWPGTTLRESFWLTQLGPEYMDSAFVWANRADPAAKLYINENLAEFANQKTDALFALVQGMRSRGVPIDGVGFQMHVPLGHPSYVAYNTYKTDPISPAVRATFARFADAGFDVRITELDVELADTAGPEALAKQGQVYRDVLDACLRVSRCLEMTTWGMTDKYSWIPVNRPGYGRALPFDAAYQAKPAVDSLLARLRLP